MHLGPVLVFQLAVLILTGVSFGIVFDKAGRNPWLCLVPVYNLVVFCQIAEKSPWTLLGYLIPIVNLYFIATNTHAFSKKFGGGGAMTAGLLFLPFIFYPILAFGDFEYDFPMPPQPISNRSRTTA